jgi:hypothetical protein
MIRISASAAASERRPARIQLIDHARGLTGAQPLQRGQQCRRYQRIPDSDWKGHAFTLAYIAHHEYDIQYRQNTQEGAMNDSMPAKLDPDAETKRINMMAPITWLRKIDDWRRQQPDLPNISEAIRRLVDAGLEASKKGGKHGR